MDDPKGYFMEAQHAEAVDVQSQGHVSIARSAWLQGDFDTARMAYQKCAYISGRLQHEETKTALKRELAGFSKNDPLYKEVLSAIRPLVEQRPGIKQTDLYSCVNYDRETVAYVLYFAAEVFDLYRKKAGRTYQIFPPGIVIDANASPLLRDRSTG